MDWIVPVVEVKGAVLPQADMDLFCAPIPTMLQSLLFDGAGTRGALLQGVDTTSVPSTVNRHMPCFRMTTIVVFTFNEIFDVCSQLYG